MLDQTASQIVSMIVPYLVQAGQAAAESVVPQVLEAIRKKFKGDEYAKQTLKRLEEKPKDEGRAGALSMILAEKMRSDRQFAALLEKYTKEFKQPTSDVITQNITIDRNSKVGGNITQTGKREVRR
jgi:hypothetical protein